MKKRLRKKLHLGEFREDCFEIEFSFDPPLSPEAFDNFWDDFVCGLIEAEDLQFGGGGDPASWHGFVEKAGRGTVRERDRQIVVDWLEQHPDVSTVSAGPLRDAWYGWET